VWWRKGIRGGKSLSPKGIGGRQGRGRGEASWGNFEREIWGKGWGKGGVRVAQVSKKGGKLSR